MYTQIFSPEGTSVLRERPSCHREGERGAMKASRKRYCLVSRKINVFDLWLLLNGNSFKFCPLKDQMNH